MTILPISLFLVYRIRPQLDWVWFALIVNYFTDPKSHNRGFLVVMICREFQQSIDQ